MTRNWYGRHRCKYRLNSRTKKFLGISLQIFVLLIVILIGLPAPLLILNVPSFSIGQEWYLILKWINDTTGFRVEFKLLPIIILAICFGLLISIWQWLQPQEHD